MTKQTLQKVAAAKATEVKSKSDLVALANEEGLQVPAKATHINDVLELLAFIEALLVVLVEAFLNGISLFDALDVLRSQEVRSAFGPAVDNVSDIPNELGDLNGREWRILVDRATQVAFTVWDTLTGG